MAEESRAPGGKRDATEGLGDVLRVSIIGPDGQQWYQDALAVPREGEEVVVFTRDKKAAWRGTVKKVTWAVIEGVGGMVVNVQLG
jgi:hypothetical protein